MPYSARSTVKEYLNIPLGTTTEDAQIDAALSAADARIDNYCGRTFVVATGTTTRDMVPWDSTTVVLPNTELQSANSITIKLDTTGDGTFDETLTSADWFLVGDQAPFQRITRRSGQWPIHRDGRASVQVEGEYGYQATVPDAVVQASTMLAARHYQRATSPLGFQTGIGELGFARVSKIDADVADLLSPYRRPGIA